MFAMSLVEEKDYRVSYGILFCDNDEISENDIQQKIYEIKNQLIQDGRVEWLIDEVITKLPDEWKIWFQESNEAIEI